MILRLSARLTFQDNILIYLRPGNSILFSDLSIRLKFFLTNDFMAVIFAANTEEW
jgi:hypothetical protein